MKKKVSKKLKISKKVVHRKVNTKVKVSKKHNSIFKLNNGILYSNDNLNIELFNKYEKEIRKVLFKKDPTRYWHSISVALTAVALADIYGADKDDCLVAGLLHDYAKFYNKKSINSLCKKYHAILFEEDLKATGCVHGFIGAYICRDKFKINMQVFDAIYFHTCGRPNMTMLEKIIYMSDLIEPLRKFRDRISDLRKLTFKDIDKAIYLATQVNLKYLIDRKLFIHSNTYRTMEYYAKVTKKFKINLDIFKRKEDNIS